MYSSSPEEQTSPPESANSPSSNQRTKPGSYGKACDTCRKKKARCNFEKPTCGYCSAFKHQCSYTAAAACANRRNAKKLSIETKRQRTAPPPRRSTLPFKQPYSADPNRSSGYLTPITPLERGLQSAGPGYHHSRGPELLGSPHPRSSAYSPDSTSPTGPLSPANGHGMQRYQDVRPYGQSSNGYIQDTRTLLPKMSNPQREDSYVAVPLMGDQTGTGKEQQGQGHNMMDPPASPHPFSSSGMHQQDQIQRVVSPVNQASMAHYQAQYAGYEGYHRNDMDVSQHDPRQQMQADWNTRTRSSMPLPAPGQSAMYRYHEVEGQNNYIR